MVEVQQVMVLGGGYAGVMAANRLAGSMAGDGVRVVLVNERDAFVERIRLHELAAGSRQEALVPFASVLHPSVDLVVARATAIRAAAGAVSFDDGSTRSYDALVYAVGSGGDQGAMGPNVSTVDALDGARQLRARLDTMPKGAAIAVVGGGLTAVETAAEVAQQHPSLRVSLLASGEVAAGMSDRGRERIRSGLRRTRVTLRAGTRVDPSASVAADLGVDAVIWCAGMAVPRLASTSGLPVDHDGRLMVGPTLMVEPSADDEPILPPIFGAGDAVRIAKAEYAYLRMSCAAAMPMGAHAADGVARLRRGLEPSALSFGFVAQCIGIGRGRGLLHAVARDDTPRSLMIGGRLGAHAKETIARHTLQLLRHEARRPGSYAWAEGPQA